MIFSRDCAEYQISLPNGKTLWLLLNHFKGKVKAPGIERRGMWGGSKGTLWPHFDEVTRAQDAASDHAAL